MKGIHLSNKPIKASVYKRNLINDDKRLKYNLSIRISNTKHAGQRKLLLGEIEFIISNYKKLNENNKIILYIGASMGKTSVHIYTLVQLFPEFTYHLYDVYDFYPKLYECSNVIIHKQYFTNDDMEQYKNKNILLISDMRNIEMEDKSNIDKMNRIVLEDNDIQKDFYEGVNPKAALLKFRLPWNNKKTKYLNGKIYFQAWQGSTSAETRLVPNKKYKTYDNTKYEEQLFYFNVKTRKKYYKHDYDVYCHCYDCFTEITILKKYIKFKKLKISIYELAEQISSNLSVYSNNYIFPKNSKYKI